MTDADLADIKRTIRHWRNRGVIDAVVSELHCRRDWASVERCMVRWLMGYEIAELSRRAA
jgi:hypothetical protein